MAAVESPPPQIPLGTEAVHALSNHLAVILGFIELVLGDTPPEDPRYGDLIEIRNAAIEAAKMIGRPIGRTPAR